MKLWNRDRRAHSACLASLRQDLALAGTPLGIEQEILSMHSKAQFEALARGPLDPMRIRRRK